MSQDLITMQGEHHFYSFAYLRLAAHHSARIANEREAGSNIQRVITGILCAFTIEAYLNHLAETILCIPNYDERMRWNEKYEFVSQHLGLPVDRGRRPYQTIGQAFYLRDRLAHGRDHHNLNVEFQIPTEAPIVGQNPDPAFIQMWWREEQVQRCLNDMNEIMRTFHQAAGLNPITLDWIGHGTFEQQPTP